MCHDTQQAHILEVVADETRCRVVGGVEEKGEETTEVDDETSDRRETCMSINTTRAHINATDLRRSMYTSMPDGHLLFMHSLGIFPLSLYATLFDAILLHLVL